MSWARTFPSKSKQEEPLIKQSEQTFLYVRRNFNVYALLGVINGILVYYDNFINSRLKSGENKVAHRLKRLNPFSKQKFFCGIKGNLRANHFANLLNAQDTSDAQKLRNIGEYAFRQYEAAWIDSWLARKILTTIGEHLGLRREVKYHVGSAENGGDFTTTERMSNFLTRVHMTLMATSFGFEEQTSGRELMIARLSELKLP